VHLKPRAFFRASSITNVSASQRDAIAISSIGLDAMNLRLYGPKPQQPLRVSFDRVYDQLDAQGWHCEPDGSIGKGASTGSVYWRLELMLYDHENRLQYVDVTGTCDPLVWDQLIELLGDELTYFDPRAGQWLDRAEAKELFLPPAPSGSF
jgi:hypothetical protein